MPHMLRRAKDAFPSLLPAEVEMISNAGSGRKTDCKGLAADTIRSKVLVWLCTDRWAKTRVARTGLDIRNVKLKGDLDLSYSTIPWPLRLLESEIDGIVDLRGAKTHLLDFSGTHVDSIEAAGARVDGDLRLRYGFEARHGVHLCDAKVESDLDCRRGVFGKLVNAVPSVDGAHDFGQDDLSILADRVRVGGRILLLGNNSGDKADNVGGIYLRNAQIEGFVQLESVKISCDTIYAIRADLMKITGALYIRNCCIEGQVGLLDAKIGGSLNCAGSTFKGPTSEAVEKAEKEKNRRPKAEIEPALFMDGIQIGSDLLLNHQFRAHQEVRFLGARIRGDVQFEGATFFEEAKALSQRAIEFTGSRIDGSVGFIDNFQAFGEICISHVTIGGMLMFQGRIKALNKAINARGSSVARDIQFLPSKDQSKPTRIEGAIDFSSVRIGGDLIFGDGKYILNRENSDVSDNLREFAAILAEGANVGGMLRFDRGCHVQGMTWLVGIKVGQDLICTGSHFDQPSAQDINVFKKKHGEYIAFNAARSRVAGEFRWRPDDRGAPPKGIVGLAHMMIDRLHDSEASWPEKETDSMRLDGFTYNTIHPDSLERDELKGNELGRDRAIDRRKWLARQIGDRFSLQPYEQLFVVYHEIGLEWDAREIAIEKQKQVTKRRRERGGEWWLLRRMEWGWRQLLEYLVGYGYRPFRGFSVFIILWLVGALMFNLAANIDRIYPTKWRWFAERTETTLLPEEYMDPTTVGVRKTKKPLSYPEYQPLIYSLDLMVSFVSLGQVEYWEIQGDVESCWFLEYFNSRKANPTIWTNRHCYLKWYKWFHILFGHFLILLIALSPTRLLRKD